MMVHTDNMEYKRLFFKPSGSKGNFTSSVNVYAPESAIKTKVGELVVLSFPGSGINKRGRWDVKVRKMSGKGRQGYIVVSAEWSTDEITIDFREKTFVVQVMINGKEDRLVCEDKAILPIAFSCRKYTEPEIIASFVERKIAYLQMSKGFDTVGFCERFIQECRRMYELYEKSTVLEEANNRTIDLSILKERYGKR